MPDSKSDRMMHGESIFDFFPNCVRFKMRLNLPFPEIPEPIVSTELWKGEFPVSFRLSSATRKFSDSYPIALTMNGIVPVYPSLPSLLKCDVILDISLPVSGDFSRFDKLFGNDIWLYSLTASQEIVLGELNRVVDLARHNEVPQYMLRNISVFDMEQLTIYEVADGTEAFKSTLFPQVTGGSIKLDHNLVKRRAELPFYFRNYLDARRHLSEFRFHEMQISASNAIEAGSWFLWELAKSKLPLSQASALDYNKRYNAVSKAIRENWNRQNGVPTRAIRRVWKRRQAAMHGELVSMSNQDAGDTLTHLTRVMNYVETTANLLRSYTEPDVDRS